MREPRRVQRRAVQLRDRLLINYSPLVKYVAGRIGARTGWAVDQESLISWGILGLLDAIETYDPVKGSRFETYAISKIRWAIFDEMRSQDWVPRRVRAQAQNVEDATIRLTQRLRRSPTVAEIAAEAGLGLADYREFLEQYSRAQITSLEASQELDGKPGSEIQAFIADPSATDPQSQASLEDIRVQLTEAIKTLNEQERKVATFYFYEGLTLKEIGKAMNLSEGRISQILRRALAKLRERLQDASASAAGWRQEFE